MRKVVRFLDRVMSPVLILSYIALCLMLLAVSPGVNAFLAMVWGGVMMAALRWGIWGILSLGRRMNRDPIFLKVLTRTVEVLQVLLILSSIFVAVLLWSVPSVWLLIPSAFFGLRGAIRFDAEYL